MERIFALWYQTMQVLKYTLGKKESYRQKLYFAKQQKSIEYKSTEREIITIKYQPCQKKKTIQWLINYAKAKDAKYNKARQQRENYQKLLLKQAEWIVQSQNTIETTSQELQTISEEVQKANEQLVRQFTAILQRMENIVHEAITVMQQAEKQLLSFLSNDTNQKKMSLRDSEDRRLFIDHIKKKYNDLLQQVIGELVLTHKRKSEDIIALDTISLKVGQIQTHMTEIIEIANGIKLIAINTGIEAARAGENGRVFSAIAENINRLTQTSADAAQNMTDELENTNRYITATIGKIKESMDAESSYLNSTIAIIKDVFLSMTDTLFGLIMDLSKTLIDSMGNNSEVKGQINQLITTLQLEKYTTEIDMKLLPELNQTTSQAQELINELSTKGLIGKQELLSWQRQKSQTKANEEPTDDVVFF